MKLLLVIFLCAILYVSWRNAMKQRKKINRFRQKVRNRALGREEPETMQDRVARFEAEQAEDKSEADSEDVSREV